MTPEAFLAQVIDPACDLLSGMMGKDMGSHEARVELLAIALIETRLIYRKQVRGPARGRWQFERDGGCKGVMTHEASSGPAQMVCKALDIPWDEAIVFEALAWNDTLACCFARLLLWTDRDPLPDLGDEDAAWDYYLANWRPGKPQKLAWAKQYGIAYDALAKLWAAPERYAPPVAPAPAASVAAADTATPAVEEAHAGLMDAAADAVDRASRSGWFTSEFAFSVLGVAGLLATTLLDQMTMLNPSMRDSSYIIMAYAVSRGIAKAATLFQTPTPQQGKA
jgi:hypothetical protein